MSDAAKPEFWISKWTAGKAKWHMEDVNPFLRENFRTITNGEKGLRILVPLCGKTVAMTWFLQEGHTVVGVEVATQAAEEFFEDIPHTVTPINGCDGQMYKSNDGKCVIYNCSYFDLTPDIAGTFDAVWDRGSLVALPPDVWDEYRDVLTKLMKPTCRYLLQRVGLNEIPGPPFHLTEQQLRDLFSEYEVKLLHSHDDFDLAKLFNCSKMHMCYYLITQLK